jgi:hypothetical protein
MVCDSPFAGAKKDHRQRGLPVETLVGKKSHNLHGCNCYGVLYFSRVKYVGPAHHKREQPTCVLYKSIDRIRQASSIAKAPRDREAGGGDGTTTKSTFQE